MKNKIIIKPEEFTGRPKYEILEPILKFLLVNGNEIATDYRWGSNQTGYFCLLKYSLDIEGIEKNFILPPTIKVSKKFQYVDYGLGTVSISKA